MNRYSLTLLALLLAGCAPVETSEMVIGVPTILSGEFAIAGKQVVQAAELAAELSGQPVRIVAEDAGCAQGRGLSAVMKLVEVDNADVIIGATCTDDTLAAAPYANEQSIPYLVVTTGGENVDNAGEFIFRIGNSDVQAGRQVAIDIKQKLNKSRAAVITEQNEYTFDLRRNFIEHYNGSVVFDEQYQQGETDFKTLITKTKATNPDVVVLLSQLGRSGGNFIKQAKEQNLNVTFVTTFATATNTEVSKEILEGVYFHDPAYDEEKSREFFSIYEEKYGEAPVIPSHIAATYDAMQLVLDAHGESFLILQNGKNRNGLMGTYSLDEKGNSDIGFTLKRVQNGTVVSG